MVAAVDVRHPSSASSQGWTLILSTAKQYCGVWIMDWFPWYPERYKNKTLHLTVEQGGIYRRLIDHYMETRQPLPDNDGEKWQEGSLRLGWSCMNIEDFYQSDKYDTEHSGYTATAVCAARTTERCTWIMSRQHQSIRALHWSWQTFKFSANRVIWASSIGTKTTGDRRTRRQDCACS